MNKNLANLLIVVGFCVGAAGATGFHDPASTATDANPKSSDSTEATAIPLFGAGLLLIVLGGVILRRASSGGDEDAKRQGTLSVVRTSMQDVLSSVSGMASAGTALDDGALLRDVDQLRTGAFFALGERHEELAQVLGFDAYAEIWSDVATCERLMNRAWSMTADGHGDEGRAELPLAQEAMDRACAAFERVAS